MNLYDLSDYSLSKMVLQDLPGIIDHLKILKWNISEEIAIADKYSVYKDVADINLTLKDLDERIRVGIVNLERFLKDYTEINKTKGILK